jgi:hypothetical protein
VKTSEKLLVQKDTAGEHGADNAGNDKVYPDLEGLEVVPRRSGRVAKRQICISRQQFQPIRKMYSPNLIFLPNHAQIVVPFRDFGCIIDNSHHFLL